MEHRAKIYFCHGVLELRLHSLSHPHGDFRDSTCVCVLGYFPRAVGLLESSQEWVQIVSSRSEWPRGWTEGRGNTDSRGRLQIPPGNGKPGKQFPASPVNKGLCNEFVLLVQMLREIGSNVQEATADCSGDEHELRIFRLRSAEQ